MILRELQSVNFRSYPQLSMHFGPGLNAIVGPNGAGKTNVLDMVYYLSLCKSPQGLPDPTTLRHGAERLSLFGRYDTPGGPCTASLTYQPGVGKSVRFNDKPYERLGDHVGRLPLAAVYPHDARLISDGGELKRRFMNFAISQYDRAYLSHLARLEHMVAQRNAYLKRGAGANVTVIESIDAQLVEPSQAVQAARDEFCQALSRPFAECYAAISGSQEAVGIAYQSQLGGEDYLEQLQRARSHDLRVMHTTVGVHRDSMEFTIDGHTARSEGSQGQQKTFLIALRLAQYLLLHQRLGDKPILLLDDILDRLDKGRAQRLLALLGKEPYGQVLLTHCEQREMEELVADYPGDKRIYAAGDNALVELSSTQG